MENWKKKKKNFFFASSGSHDNFLIEKGSMIFKNATSFIWSFTFYND